MMGNLRDGGASGVGGVSRDSGAILVAPAPIAPTPAPAPIAFALALMLALAAVFATALCPGAPERAFADEMYTVRIGYFGGPYYDKATYSKDDLVKLMEDVNGGELYEYSSMDKGGFLRKGFARGIPLVELLDNAGIDSSAIASFYFDTADGYKVEDEGNPVKQWSYDALLGTRRYYYASLWQYYDFQTLELPAKYKSTVEGDKRIVATVVALESSFERVGAGGEAVWNDSSLVSSNAGIRLMFGQTAATDSTAGFSAHSIEGVKVTFSGHPTIKVSRTDLSGEVGETIEIEYSLEAADELLAAKGAGDVTWTVADDSVAQIVSQGNGKLSVKIVGEGETSLVASYGDSDYEGATSAQVGVAGSAASTEDEKSKEAEDPEQEEKEDSEGSGAGSGGSSASGSGNANGSGSGSSRNESTTTTSDSDVSDPQEGQVSLDGSLTELNVPTETEGLKPQKDTTETGGNEQTETTSKRVVELDEVPSETPSVNLTLDEDDGLSVLLSGVAALALLVLGAIVHAGRFRRQLGLPNLDPLPSGQVGASST